MVIPDNKAGEAGRTEDTGPIDAFSGARNAVDAAGKTVVAAALAGAVASGAAAVTPDQVHLPDPAPIVQMADQGLDLPDSSTDEQAEKKASAWKRFLQILKFVLVALFFVAAALFGVLQGCASCAGQVALPVASSETSQSSS